MNRSSLGLLVTCLLMLGGCSGKQLVKTETAYQLPPEALMQDCPETAIPANGNNGDLLEVAASLRLDLQECNRKNARLRQWAEEHKAMGKGK